MYGERSLTITDSGSGRPFPPSAIAIGIPVLEDIEPTNRTQSEPDAKNSVPENPAVESHETVSNNNILAKSPKSLPIKKLVFALAASVVLLVGGVSGYHFVNDLFTHQETDDAYTTGHQHQISTRINGTIDHVLVDDNEHVKKGQVIAILDPRDYEVKVAQAKASLQLALHQAEAAKTSVTLADTNADGKTTEAEAGVLNAEAAVSKSQAALFEAQAAVPQAEADLHAKQAEETRAKADGKRFVVLAQEGAVSLQQRDTAVRDYEVAKSNTEAAAEVLKQSRFKLDQAREAVRIAKAQLTQSKGVVQQANATHVQTQVNEKQYDVAQSSIQQAEVALRDAELQLSYTKILAPVDGRIGKKTAEPGQRVQPGQQLMTVVSDDIWIVANFKETQLEQMRPMQKVEIKVDSFPHHKFSGTVDSVSPGSGASFALLPPDNATGNFTKIVQRVPVKIRFDSDSVRGYERLIVPGMSAVVNVDVNDPVQSSSALAHHKVRSFVESGKIESERKG